MNTVTKSTGIEAVANEVLAALAARQQITPFTSRPGGLALDDAYCVTPLLRAALEARGEKILGRKIGFTNRSIWAQYGVYAPIWGYVTDATVHALTPGTTVRTADFAEPRIEPEIMFGLKRAPVPDMDEAALLDCIDWVALGYEIVQSIFPEWKFAAADTVAVNALHGALYVGPRHAIASRRMQWVGALTTFTAELFCNGALVDRGGGGAVLDSPLSALRHLVIMLSKDSHNPPIAADEIISTGTLTKAMPAAAAEIWTTKVAGIPLEDIGLRFR